MARNVNPGITFYRMDSGHITNKKVRLMMNEFGSDGYYIWKCLIDFGYKTWGYYYDHRDKDQLELFASEYCRKKLTLVNEVIIGCLRRGLFDQAVFDSSGILTSAMMQEIFVFATSDRRKKGSEFEMQGDWLKIKFKDKVPVNMVIVPGKNDVISSEESTDKTRQYNTKQNLAPDKPVPTSSDTEPFWKELVDVWFEFGKEKFSVYPSFKAQDPKIFKRLIQLLKKRAAAKNVEWTQDTGPLRLRSFLEGAFKDEWLCKHFLLKNLENQFDQIIQRQSTAGDRQPKAVPVIPVKTTGTTERVIKMDVNFLYGRYLEDSSRITIEKIVDPKYYDEIIKAELISFDWDQTEALKSLAIQELEVQQLENNDTNRNNYMKKFAVLECFKQYSKKGKETIFT